MIDGFAWLDMWSDLHTIVAGALRVGVVICFCVNIRMR